MGLFSNTLSILKEDIHLLVFSCPQGSLRSGVSHRLASLQGSKIWDDLPNQQETLPPQRLSCPQIIRSESLPVKSYKSVISLFVFFCHLIMKRKDWDPLQNRCNMYVHRTGWSDLLSDRVSAAKLTRISWSGKALKCELL